MKRFSLFLVLLLVAFSLLATTGQLKLHEVFKAPTQLVGQSMYDYMPGAYDGYPLRIHDSNVISGGMFFTYQSQPPGLDRMQYWAFVDMQGELLEQGKVTSQSIYREGFGTLGLDPSTGSVFYAWHAVPGEYYPPGSIPAEPLMNTFFTVDYYSWTFWPGQGLNPFSKTVQDNHLEENVAARKQFIWPVVHVGPSPLMNHRRVYIFHHNGGRLLYPESDPYAASNVLIKYTDFSDDDIDSDAFTHEHYDSNIWFEVSIPYLDRMHNWFPDEVGDRTRSRAFMSYAVAPEGPLSGYIGVAGEVYVSEDHTEWSQQPEHHNYMFFVSKNYGETFSETGFKVETREPWDEYLKFNPDEVAVQPEDVRAWVEAISSFPELDPDASEIEYSEKVMWSNMVNHKTITFDRFGRIHMPTSYMFWARSDDLEWNEGYPRWAQQSVHNFVFDSNDNSLTIKHIEPTYTNYPPLQIPFPYDRDNDGFVDINPEENGPWYFYPSYPFGYGGDGFIQVTGQINQFRLSEANQEIIVMMWIDGYKAEMYSRYGEDFPEFNETTEISIAVSIDSGDNWSLPFRLNNLMEGLGDLGKNQAAVYPADKVFYVSEDIIRVFFFYMDDNSWGPFINDPPYGSNLGGILKYAAVDFDVSDLIKTDADPRVPRPISMLNQNFPNPFNPTTTIKFNVPRTGNTKINVYNVRGQLVKTLVDGNFTAGNHEVTWHGDDNNSRSVASGVYFYKMETNGVTETRRMVLMK